MVGVIFIDENIDILKKKKKKNAIYEHSILLM